MCYKRLEDANQKKRTEDVMMPLTFAKPGEEVTIQKIGGKAETRKFLETLGFVTGESITVVNQMSGNLIINVKESRVALSKEMASKITVQVEG